MIAPASRFKFALRILSPTTLNCAAAASANRKADFSSAPGPTMLSASSQQPARRSASAAKRQPGPTMPCADDRVAAQDLNSTFHEKIKMSHESLEGKLHIQADILRLNWTFRI
ncbi:MULTISPECIES: hypothetical protein [unclassified Methylobacterium]|uniref:hypothetical protein n=1 Tax=unclassified Methylobacterium TaxID=2615210 RepID=UPI001650081C|nr:MULTISPECIES: hypothetical protein [unclassified Methylobacterium]